MGGDDGIRSRSEFHLLATNPPEYSHWFLRLFPPASRAELWGGLALIGLSMLGAAWVIKCRSDALSLERDAVTVEGKVLRLWVTTGKGSGLHVAYEYPDPLELGARTFRDETKLDDEHFALLKEGGPVAVDVCRTNPANHQVVGKDRRVLASNAALVFCIGLLALPALAGVINLWWWCVSHRKPGPCQVFILSVKTVE
jgi:hypothetical protein